MDPLMAAAERIVGYLAPIALGKAVELTQKLGEDVVHKVAGWLDRLRTRWAGDAEAERALDAFAIDPQENAARLRDLLADRMAKDEDLRSSAQQLAQNIGPRVVVTMSAGEVEVQRGPEFGRVLRGEVVVSQSLFKGIIQCGGKFGDIG